MEESFKYIEILCKVGCGGHTANTDFEYSIKAARPYLDLLESLDYNKMFGESLKQDAVEYLKKWHSSNVECVSLKWLRRNACEMLINLKRLYKDSFRELGDTQYKEGNWTLEQYRDWRLMCDRIVYGWHDRFMELMKSYNLKPNTKLIDKPIRSNGRKEGDKSHRRPDKEFDKSQLYDGIYCFPGGIKTGYNFSNTITIKEVKACVFKAVLQNRNDNLKYDNTLYFTRAIEQAKPEAISSGVRLEVLQFIFLKFAEHFVENKDEYLKSVKEGFYKLKPTFDFSDPNKCPTEIRNMIWDEDEKNFK